MKRQPHVRAARLVLGILNGSCSPVSSGVARFLGIRQSAANKLLGELFEEGILVRRQERRGSIPPMWVYDIAPGWTPPTGKK